MPKRAKTPTPPSVNRCRATNQAGKPCRARPLEGGALCSMHDPERGPSVRRAGVEARAVRADLLTPEEAAELVKLRHPADVPATLENIARLTATGRLDARRANVLVQLAGNAERAYAAAVEHREREEREARIAAAVAARAAYEATPLGQRERAAQAALDKLLVANLEALTS